MSNDVNNLINTVMSNQAAVQQYATILTCLVEFNAIEQALSIQDEMDKNQMQLLGGGSELKIPEKDPDITNSRSARNSSILSTGMALSKLTGKMGGGPIKGLPLNTTKHSNDSKMLTFLNSRSNIDVK